MIISIFRVNHENENIEFQTELLATQYCMENSIDPSLIEPFDKTIPDQLPVIKSVTKRQFRQAMRISGITPAMVLQVIATIQDELERDLATIAWEDEINYGRYDIAVVGISQAMGLTSSQVDDLFILASSL